MKEIERGDVRPFMAAWGTSSISVLQSLDSGAALITSSDLGTTQNISMLLWGLKVIR